MIKDDKTREKMKSIIRENQDKTLNKLKNMIKNKLPKEEREEFTFNDLMQLISEINQDREKEIQKFYSKRPTVFSRKTKNTRNIEGDER